jgi:basic membrane protein A and related proteins
VDGGVKADNVRSLVFNEQEGSFLAGYVAGLMTKTNKVGFVGGMDNDLIHKFEAGYFAGAKTANPDVEMLAPKYSGSWDDVVKCKAAANVLFSQGADVVYQAAGRGGLGVIEAAKEQRKFAIGVDNDQDELAKGNVLTSMVKHVDEAVYQTIKDVRDGKFTAGVKVYDLKGGGVGLSEMKFTKDKVGKENLARLDKVKAQILKGEVKVPATREDLTKYVGALKK